MGQLKGHTKQLDAHMGQLEAQTGQLKGEPANQVCLSTKDQSSQSTEDSQLISRLRKHLQSTMIIIALFTSFFSNSEEKLDKLESFLFLSAFFCSLSYLVKIPRLFFFFYSFIFFINLFLLISFLFLYLFLRIDVFHYGVTVQSCKKDNFFAKIFKMFLHLTISG